MSHNFAKAPLEELFDERLPSGQVPRMVRRESVDESSDHLLANSLGLIQPLMYETKQAYILQTAHVWHYIPQIHATETLCSLSVTPLITLPECLDLCRDGGLLLFTGQRPNQPGLDGVQIAVLPAQAGDERRRVQVIRVTTTIYMLHLHVEAQLIDR